MSLSLSHSRAREWQLGGHSLSLPFTLCPQQPPFPCASRAQLAIRAPSCGGLDPISRDLLLHDLHKPCDPHEPSNLTMGGAVSAVSRVCAKVTPVLSAAADVLQLVLLLISKKPTLTVDLTPAIDILPPKPTNPPVPGQPAKPVPRKPTIEELVEDARKKLDMDVVNHYNFAVVGQSGAGKSSLINAFRQMKDSDKGAAPVGEIETTMQIQKYPHPVYPHVVLWDLPGAGTLRQPESTYFEDKMLYAFDCILVLTADRFMKVDFQIAKKAKEFKRPCTFVRTKADLSVKSIAQREGKPMLEASKALRRMVDESFQKGLKDCGFPADTFFQLFIVSAWAFRTRNAYALYNMETGDIDRGLAMMDEEQLLMFVTDSLRFRHPK